jgi:UDP-N-acetylglucosamine diphosphorylase/glucosamine-1-phosphate N-acetyltransferase
MQSVSIFEDARGDLAIQADLRAAFDVRTGAFTLIERLGAEGVRVTGLFPRAGLEDLTSERHHLPVNAWNEGGEPAILLNARLLRPAGALIAAIARAGAGNVIVHEGDIVAANLHPRDLTPVLAGAPIGGSLRAIELESVVASLLPSKPADGPVLMSRPWHPRLARDALLRHDLSLLIDAARTSHVREHAPGAWCAASASIHPSAIFDAEHGPIYLDQHAIVRPGAIIIGPVYVGPHSTVLERATIRPNTSIGPWCKVNGEVGGTIFQAYSNKAHDGYLGDSWIGEWVNFGAGTTGSNLLNTYGEVLARATPDARTERTGEAFVGAMVGDHVKTAICTRLMTGCVIGTGAMIATSAPASGCVPAFSWNTDEGRRAYRFDKFVDVARAAMKRRGVEPSAAYLKRLETLHGSAT